MGGPREGRCHEKAFGLQTVSPSGSRVAPAGDRKAAQQEVEAELTQS